MWCINLCINHVYLYIYAYVCLLSHQGKKQCSDGGHGQSKHGGPGHPGGGVAQVGVAAGLGHGVDGGGVGDFVWEIHIFGFVALSLF